MIDGSDKRNCQLAFELHNPHVCEKRSNNDATPPQSEFDASRIRLRLGGLPHLKTFTWQNLTPAERATRFGGSPHLSCKRDQIKMREYVDWRVTPPKRVTSPTWGPSLPCKQALN